MKAAYYAEWALMHVESTTLPRSKAANPPKKPDKRDLWQEALDGLDQKSQDLLNDKNHPSTQDTIQEVIENTKQAYEKHGQGDLTIPRLHGGHIRVRELAGNIIQAALGYNKIISAATAFDPTGHAAAAWGLLSIGLTILEASEYLSGRMVLYATIDTEFRNEGSAATTTKIEDALVRLYTAILKYTVEVKRKSNLGAGGRLILSVTALSEEPFSRLQDSIKECEDGLDGWRRIAAHQGERGRSQDISSKTDEILNRVDETVRGIMELRGKILSKEELDVLDWLSSIDYSVSQNRGIKSRKEETGDWFLESSDFKNWVDSPGGLLWLYGVAGCGKSVLCSTIIDHLEQRFGNDPRISIPYWYFQFDVADSKTFEKMARCLIRQLSSHSIPPQTMRIWHEHRSKGSNPDHQALVSALHAAISSAPGNVFLVLDAVDECPVQPTKERDLVLKLLHEMCEKHSSKVHVLVTSRPEHDIRSKLTDCRKIDLEKELEKDVEKFVRLEVERICEPDEPNGEMRWPPRIQESMLSTLLDGPKLRFRWADLQIKRLEERCHDENDVLEALRTIPETLEEFYQVTLDSIKDKKEQSRAYDILVFLALSFEPLELDTVAEAASLPHSDSVVKICTTTFVHVEPSTNQVRLAHFSVKEFLVTQRVKPKWYHFLEIEGHRALANKTLDCLLDVNDSSASPLDVSENASSYTLYSAANWYEHVTRLGNDANGFKDLQDKIFCLFHDELSRIYLHWLVLLSQRKGESEILGKSPLYHACRLGLKPAVERLLDDKADLLEEEISHGLIAANAATDGYFEILEIILKGSKIIPAFAAFSIICQLSKSRGPFSKLTPLLDRMWDLGALSQNSDVKVTRIPTLVSTAACDSGYAIEIWKYLLARQPEAGFTFTKFTVTAMIFCTQNGSAAIEFLLRKELSDLQFVSECLNDAEYPIWIGASKALKMLLVNYMNDLSLSEQTMWKIALLKGAEEHADLLLRREGDRPKVTEERLGLAASRVHSARHMRILLDAMEPGTKITEGVLLSSTRNWICAHEVLSALLDYCDPGTTVGESIVLAVISSELSSALKTMQMLLRRQCMRCTASEELLESAASRGLEVFELLWKNRGPSITERIVSSALAQAPLIRWLWDMMGSSLPLQPDMLERAVICENEEAVKIILDQYPDICPSLSVWDQVAENANAVILAKLIDLQSKEFPNAHFLDVMLRHRYNDAITSVLQLLLDRNLVILDAKTAEQIASNPTALEWLIPKVPWLPITESLLVATANNAALFCSLLEKQGSDVTITEIIMMSAVSNDLTIIELFRRVEEPLPISDKVLSEAMRQGNGRVLLSSLFKRGDTEIPVTGKIIREAFGYNSIMKELLRWGKRSLPITQDLLVAAACAWHQARLLLLLREESTSFHEGMKALYFGEEHTTKFVGDETKIMSILEHTPITERVAIEVAENYNIEAVFASWLQRQDGADLQSLFESLFHLQSGCYGGIWNAIDSLMEDPEHKAEGLRRISNEFPIHDRYFDNFIRMGLSVDTEIHHTPKVVELVVERCKIKRIQAFLDRYGIQLTGSLLEAFERKVEMQCDASD